MTLYLPNALFLGHPCERQSTVLHDPSNNWVLLRFHASCVHTSKLNRLCLRTPDGQRYGEKTTTKTHYITAHTCCFQFPNKMCVWCSQVKTGFVMNILGILCVSLAMNTWGLHMFNLHIYPDWARPLNASSATVATHTIAMNMTG